MTTTLEIRAPLNSQLQYPGPVLHVGTKSTLQFTVTERDGVTAVDLTGLTVKLQAREDHNDASLLLDLTGSLSDAPNGICTVEIAATDLPDPKELWVELILEDSGGDQVGSVSFWMPVVRGAA